MRRTVRTIGAGIVGALVVACSTTVVDSGRTSEPPNDAATGDGSASNDASTCQPVLDYRRDTGYDECSDGTRRRRAAISCSDWPPTGDPTVGCETSSVSCSSDADCTVAPLGHCASSRPVGGVCGCYYGCIQDSDCGSGSICWCHGATGSCTPATCATGADCAPGLACIETEVASSANACSITDPGHNLTYSCETPTDHCRTAKDCAGPCRFVGDHRVCGTDPCPV